MNEKRENQQKVLAAINDGFDFCIDQSYFLLLDEYLLPSESIGLDNVENFTEIFQAIKNYIATHKYEFRLGGNSSVEFVAEGFVEDQDPTKRPWWSPLLSELGDEGGRGRAAGCHGVCKTRKIMKGGFSIHPGALTGEEYEELKQLVPGACKVRGCCNNYSDPGGGFYSDVRFTMEGNVCRYHYLFPTHRPPFFPGLTCGNNSGRNNNRSTPNFSPPPPLIILHHSKITLLLKPFNLLLVK